VGAALVGVPVGIAVGRWGWGRVAHNLGVPSVPIVPLAAVVVVALAACFVANVIALPVGWRAARGRAAEVLRTE
jgi:hypothetical protein